MPVNFPKKTSPIMKKWMFLCMVACFAACTTPTPTTPGTDSTAQVPTNDSNAVAVNPTDSTATVDTTASTQVTDAATDTKATDNATVANNQTPGKLANPNIDLNAKRFDVSGQILWTNSYCGGAAPPQSMLDELARPKPRAKQAIIVRSGTTNALSTALVTRATTDANGWFNLSLTPGDYCICLAEKENARTKEFKNQQSISIDEPCDTKWLKTCDIVFKLRDKGSKGLKATFHQNCDVPSFSPCIQSTLPPRP
jgi:hypothetical protein